MIDHKQFVLAGKASFTLTAPTGHHFTYRVAKKKDNRTGADIWFVNLGIDYESSVYLGMISYQDGQHKFFLTKASHANESAPSVQLFKLFWRERTDPEQLSVVRFQHTGRCCVCSRELTNPESIDLGIGPECRGKSGL